MEFYGSNRGDSRPKVKNATAVDRDYFKIPHLKEFYP